MLTPMPSTCHPSMQSITLVHYLVILLDRPGWVRHYCWSYNILDAIAGHKRGMGRSRVLMKSMKGRRCFNWKQLQEGLQEHASRRGGGLSLYEDAHRHGGGHPYRNMLVERGISELTLNRESPGSNHLCDCFEANAFLFSPWCLNSLSCINGY